MIGPIPGQNKKPFTAEHAEGAEIIMPKDKEEIANGQEIIWNANLDDGDLHYKIFFLIFDS
jgi:hypothetical protein